MVYRKRKWSRKSWKTSRRGKYSRRYRTRSFQSRVKKAILKTAETKYFMGSGEQSQCYHDRGNSNAGLLTSNQGSFVFNPWYQITKGTTISQRIGDEVYPRGMALRLLYNAASDKPAQFVRLIVAVIPKIVNGVIMDGSNFDLMDSSGSNDTVSGMIKREGVKVLYDKVFTLQPQGVRAAPEVGDSRFFKKLYIKSKRGGKLTWQQDGMLANKPVGIWCVPYNKYDEQRLAMLGVLSYTYKLYFKDI